MRAVLLFLSLLLGFSKDVRAQEREATPIRAFRRFTEADGLPGNQITAFSLDSRRYLWVGTQNGVCRWDGARFTVPQEQYRFLLSQWVVSLLPLNDSLMLIGTLDGLCVYNVFSSRYENERIRDTLIRPGSSRFIHATIRLPQGRVLVASVGYLHLLDARLRTIRYRKFSAGDELRLPLPGYFFGPDSAFTVYHPGRGKRMRLLHIPTLTDTAWPARYKGLDTIPTNFLNTALRIPGTEKFLLSSWGDGGVALYDPSTGKHRMHVMNPVQLGDGNTAKCLALDPHDKDLVWLGTGHDLYTFNLRTESIIRYHFQSAPPEVKEMPNAVLSIFFDPRGGMWVGTTDGLYKLGARRRSFTAIPINESGFPIGSNDAAHLDSEGRIWIANWGRNLAVLDTLGNIVRRFDQRRDGIGNFCYRLLVVRDTIYVASDFWGLRYFDKRQKRFRKPYFIPDSLAKTEARGGTLFDSHGRWWVSYTDYGLFWYDTKTGKSGLYRPLGRDTTASGYVPLRLITAAAEDRNGDLWLGRGWLDNLVCWKRSTGRFHVVKPFLKGRYREMIHVNCLVVDSQNRLWIGTGQTGVLCYDIDRRVWTQYDRSNGINYGFVNDVLVDYQGRVWASSTELGLAVLEPGRSQFRSITSEEGLPFIDIEKLSVPDTSTPWRMMINNQRTLAWVDLRTVLQPTSVPQTYLEAVVVEGTPVDAANNTVRFNHRSSHFSFSYSAPVTEGGKNVRYAYKLEGLDKNWKEVAGERTVSFANVPPGHYKFLVRARMPDGEWGPAATYSFTIAPPFWQRWWFYALCALAVAAAVYAIYRYQLSKAIALYQVRNRISRDLHDEIGSTLSSISLMNEMAARESDGGGLQQKIGDSIQKAQGAMSDIVWMINPKNDGVGNLVLRFSEVAAELLEARGIRYSFTTEGLDGARLPMETRRELYLIFKEALNNIVKYADASEVSITLREEAKHLFMRIADNGRGFDAGRMTSGNGLHNITERAKTLRGAASIHTTIGAGTTVEVEVPLG